MRIGLVTLVWMMTSYGDITLVGPLIGSEKKCNCKYDTHKNIFTQYEVCTMVKLKTSKSGWGIHWQIYVK